MNINFLLNQLPHLNFYIPIIREINKNFISLKTNIFVKPSRKYNCPISYERNLKILLNCKNKYHFNIYNFDDIEKKEHSGNCFCVEGSGIQKKINNQKMYSFINKVDFIFNTINNPSNSPNKKSMIEKVDYLIYPSKQYAEYYNRIHKKNLYLGISRYSDEKELNLESIIKKYNLKDNSNYVTIIYPHPRDLKRTNFDIEKMCKFLKSLGYKILLKNRSKNNITSNVICDYYFEDYRNSISAHPHRTDELISISEFVINFGSTTVEEALFLKKPVINFNLKSFYHMANKTITPELFAKEQNIENIDCSKPALDFIYDYDFVINLPAKYKEHELESAINFFKNNKNYLQSFEKCWNKYYNFNIEDVNLNILNHLLSKK